MFGKVIVWAYNRYTGRLRKKYEKAQKDTKKQKEVEFYENIRKLYSFAQWLNRQFVNRKDRKGFWKRVGNGEAQIEVVMQRLLNAYKQQKVNEKKQKEEEKYGEEKTI